MAEDISKKTVAILLVIAIIISITATWAVLSARPSLNVDEKSGLPSQIFFKTEKTIPNPTPAQGVVEFGIEKS